MFLLVKNKKKNCEKDELFSISALSQSIILEKNLQIWQNILMVIVDKDIDVGQLGIFLTFSCGRFRFGKEELERS